MKLFTTKTYTRAIAKIATPEARRAMEKTIAADPLAAPVIPGTGGIRKMR